uniref:F-box domain-containing protein n=1 Tax=Acrobeloides nanus TaxID=290746 RepID=A0A914DP83_9BILA
MVKPHSGIFSEVLAYLSPEDVDSCQLVSKKWDRIICSGEWLLPKKFINSLVFSGNYEALLQHGVVHSTYDECDDDNAHFDCSTGKCIVKYEKSISYTMKDAHLLNRYFIERLRISFMDDTVMEFLQNLVKFVGQKIYAKKLIFIPEYPQHHGFSLPEMILPFFNNLNLILSSLISAEDLFIDLNSDEMNIFIQNFPSALQISKSINVHISVRNCGIPYEIDAKLLEKLLAENEIFARKSIDMDLRCINCDIFCDIFIQIFKSTKNPENLIKSVQIDGSFYTDLVVNFHIEKKKE